MTTKKRSRLRSISKLQRRDIIEEYLSGEEIKSSGLEAAMGEGKEKSRLLRWMRQLGYLGKT